MTAFDVFWQTFGENHPVFAAKGVGWVTVRDRYRPQTDAQTTDGEPVFTDDESEHARDSAFDRAVGELP